MQWLRTSKYTIFLILLKFQNLWNLINFYLFINENIYLIVSYDFLKFDGSSKFKSVMFLMVSLKDGFALLPY
jgi:hypothetical protein